MLKPVVKDSFSHYNIVAHYIAAAILFFIISVLLLISSQSFIGHYFHPKILAITHITTLGFISTIIIGSLYQFVPVITNKKIFSPYTAFITFILLQCGTSTLAHGFWTFNTGAELQIAAFLLLSGVTLFVINLLLTVKGSQEKNWEIDFILASAVWFWLTAFVGTLLAFNFEHVFLPKEHLYYLNIHAHIGLIGWFICLIIGVASRLLPMFLLSAKPVLPYLQFAYYTINAGLILFLLDLLFLNGIERSPFYIIIIIAGILSFVCFIAHAFKTRARKTLDINLKHSFLSFVLFLIPLLIWVVLKLPLLINEKLKLQLSIALAFSLLFGFIIFLILGQTFKNLAFMVWLREYQELSGKVKTPLPKDLYSEKIIRIQLYAFLISFTIILTGIILSQAFLISIGASVLVLTAILYNFNVFKIAFHKRNT